MQTAMGGVNYGWIARKNEAHDRDCTDAGTERCDSWAACGRGLSQPM